MLAADVGWPESASAVISIETRMSSIALAWRDSAYPIAFDLVLSPMILDRKLTDHTLPSCAQASKAHSIPPHVHYGVYHQTARGQTPASPCIERQQTPRPRGVSERILFHREERPRGGSSLPSPLPPREVAVGLPPQADAVPLSSTAGIHLHERRARPRASRIPHQRPIVWTYQHRIAPCRPHLRLERVVETEAPSVAAIEDSVRVRPSSARRLRRSGLSRPRTLLPLPVVLPSALDAPRETIVQVERPIAPRTPMQHHRRDHL